MACRRFRWIFLGLTLACAAAPAHAQSSNDPISYIIDQLNPLIPDFKTPPGLKVRVGAIAGLTPAFEGSEDYDFRYAPTLDVIYKDRIFLNSTRLRVNFMPPGEVRGGVQLKYRSGRKEKTSADLAGLGNVSSSLEAGAYIEARLNMVLISADLARDVTSGHKSTLASLLVGHGLYQDKDTLVGTGLQLHWAGGDYMRAFFGVDPDQSAASGLPDYSPGAGFKDAGLILYWKQDLSEKVVLQSNISLTELLNGAKHSPIVRERGSATQFLSSIGIRYEF